MEGLLQWGHSQRSKVPRAGVPAHLQRQSDLGPKGPLLKIDENKISNNQNSNLNFHVLCEKLLQLLLARELPRVEGLALLHELDLLLGFLGLRLVLLDLLN